MAFGHMDWNRKELFFKERRLERSERFEPYARWRRDSNSGGFHGFIREGLHSDLRAISGNGKQGGWNQHLEEAGHGYVPTWSSNQMLRDESCRRQVPFADGKSYRGGGQIAKQRDPRGGRFGEEGNSFSNMTRMLLDKGCNRRSVGELLSYPQIPVGCMNKSSSYYLQQKDQFRKVAGSGGSSTSQKFKKMLVQKDGSNKSGREMLSYIRTSPVDSVNKSSCYLQKNKSLTCQSHLMDQPHKTAGANRLITNQDYDKTPFSTDCSKREIGKVFSYDQRSLVDSANNFLCHQSHLEDHVNEVAGTSGVSMDQECDKGLNSTDSGEKSNGKMSSYPCSTVVDHGKKSRSNQPSLKKELSEVSRAGELVSGQSCESSVGSTDWKSFKRTRCGFSSGGLNFIHPGTSASSRDSDSCEREDSSFRSVKLPVQDTAKLVISDVPFEELTSRKKQRLGWGEGLAKYEKKKVESPLGSTYNSSVEPIQLGKSVADERLVSSPATNFTSKDLEENCQKTLNACEGFSNSVCDSMYYGSESLPEDFSLGIGKWDLTSALQFDIPSSIDSGFEGYVAIDKLIGFKANILKELEMTVSEIDSLEIELKSYVTEDKNSCIKELKDMRKDIEGMDADNPFAVASKLVNPSSANNLQGDNSRAIESPDHTTVVEQISAAGGPSGEKTNLSPFRVDGIGAECESDGIYKVSSGHNCKESALYLSILSFNKEAAKCTCEELNGLLPKDHGKVENSHLGIFSCWQNDLSITEKLVKQSKFRKFKEMALTIKFKILRFLWKEELLLSSKDNKTKCKKFSRIRIRDSKYQKWRSFLRSNFPSLGNLSIVQLQGIIDHAHYLTQESGMKICRNTLQMPALMLDKKEKITSMFISSNGLVEDPCEVERERTLVNLWTLEEKEIFLNRFAIFGKDFRKIASFLGHKTAGDCVQFYYKNHKSDWFQTAMEKLDFAAQAKSDSSCNNLVIPLKKRKHHHKAVSSELIGTAPSEEDTDGRGEGRQALNLRICGSGKKMHMVPDDQGEEENILSEGCQEREPPSWTDEEKALFIEALSTYGKDFSMISDCVGTKSSDECMIFFSKARNCLGLDRINTGAKDVQPSGNYDANGGSDSVITSAAEISKMNHESIMLGNSNKLDSLRAVNSPTDLNSLDEKSVVEHLSESTCSKRSATSIANAETGTACSSKGIVSKADTMESFFNFETKNVVLAEGSQNKLAKQNCIPFVYLSCRQEPHGIETVDEGGVWFAAQDFSIESSGSSAADTSVCSLRRFDHETSLGPPNNTRHFERISGVTCHQWIHPVTEECSKIQHVKAEDEDTPSLTLQKPSDAQELADVGGLTNSSPLQGWPLNRCNTSSWMAEHPSIPKTLQQGPACRNEPASFKLFGCILTIPPESSRPKFDLNIGVVDLQEAQHPMSCSGSSHLELYQRDTGIKHDGDSHLDLQLGSLPRYAMLPVKNDGCINQGMTNLPVTGMTNTDDVTNYGLF